MSTIRLHQTTTSTPELRLVRPQPQGKRDGNQLDDAGPGQIHGLVEEVPQMAELVRMNNPGLISVIEGILGGAGIPYQVTDRNMSVLEGSAAVIQIRILVPDEHEGEARELLVDAGLGEWLRP